MAITTHAVMSHGYGYLAESFLPRLRAAGVSESETETMTVGNPRRLLTVGDDRSPVSAAG